ncbi:hypothetical protein F4821DRAFT_229025 [Hypoxylon rubiginosum]|uniref:Uncharacterized protein n=1 Tax=Hypoxylon rubiginosum TaxID=110542 RepID=A0ACC0DCL9_9PEZI|nr:hypothetical protein F4821DRAFT_229025 [Hypoxylon rubiginosum]
MASGYEARRLANIKRNEALVKDLGLQNEIITRNQAGQKPKTSKQHAAKRRKVHSSQPTRTSARIAALPNIYGDDSEDELALSEHKPSKSPPSKRKHKSVAGSESDDSNARPSPGQDVDSLMANWSSWKPTAPPPTRDVEGNYHFESHPVFTPNKSPEDIIREGSFGGSYWRPLYSSRLRTTVSEDWRELPASWTSGLDVSKYLTNEIYNPEINKYGVACGQSIEEWELAGWIAHEYDVRGWFQWYCRFWLGRRCADDDRQVGRWKKCVGETGRWRRTLLKKYVQTGIRSVTDEGDDEGEEREGDVSPVVHQTCHHWAWEVRQEALDRFWAEGK